MNTKKAATNRNSFSFEESARRGIVDFIFYGIQNFKFLDHSSHDGKDLTPPSPPERDGSCGPSEIGVQLGAGGPGAGLEPRQKDRLEVELTSSCDKYGHSLGDLSGSFPRKWPQSRTNAPLADRFGHIRRSAELVSTVTKKQGRTDQIV
jgi:hypothetical protein